LKQYCRRIEESPEIVSAAISRIEKAVLKGGELADLIKAGEHLMVQESAKMKELH
jgi:hypothetical protein